MADAAADGGHVRFAPGANATLAETRYADWPGKTASGK